MAVICPRCSVADVSPLTGACELCGYVPGGTVTVDHPDAVDEVARRELAHQFRIDVLLGQGDSSAVYLARELESDEHVQLKVLLRPGDRRDVEERLREAAAALSGLNHPHLVPIRRHGATDSLIWYSSERVRGRSLRNVLRTEGVMSLTATLRLVTQVAGVLDYAHRRGIVHGALKPENILLDPDGWAHVCDTMVSRAIHAPARPAGGGSRASRAGEAPSRRPSSAAASPAGKPPGDTPAAETPPAAAAPAPPAVPRSPYVAPEDDLAGQVTPAADQYALAALVRECLGPQADLPLHVERALRRAQAVKPVDRFADVPDFVAALESRTVTLPDARPSGRASSSVPVLMLTDWKPVPRQRGPLVRRLVIGGVAAVALFIGWRMLERSRANRWETLPASLAAPIAIDSARAAADSAAADSLAQAQTRPSRTPRGLRAPRPATAARPPAPDEAPARTRTGATPPPAAEPAPAATAPPGRLFVNATPWGQLYLDGQLIGNTPKANLSLAPGSHTVRIVRDGFETWERTIQISSGQDLRLTDIRLVERQP